MLTPAFYLTRLMDETPALSGMRADIQAAYDMLDACFRAGGKLLLCGNGGSAADCDHIVGELMKGFLRKRPVPQAFQAHPALAGEGALLQGTLPALSLTWPVALGTAFANDVDASMAFAQQVYGYGQPGDVLWGISTSGNAQNVCHAARVARAKGLRVLGMTGAQGGALCALCDVALRVPADQTYRIQELHLPLYHALCAMLEAAFFAEE